MNNYLSHICLLVFVVIGFQSGACFAQNTITFSGRDSKTASAVTIDSIQVRNTIRDRDTTIFSASFTIDWPVTTGVEPYSRPEGFSISHNYPNAFGSTTTFQVTVPESGELEIAVYNIIGRRVASYKSALHPGVHEFMFSTGDLPDGVYLLSARLNSITSTVKLLKSGRSHSGSVDIRYMSGTTSAKVPVRKAAMIDTYTFTGYAAGYHPGTLDAIIPVSGQNYQFSFLPIGSDGISAGSSIDVLQQDVSATGGTINVTAPGCPIQGMQIEVANASYPDTRTFTVSYAPVLSHSFGENFNPISPMIILGNGGGYSEEPMIITIPVKIPAGEFAMAFLYNELTGKVEGMPILAENSTSITVVTRHFATSSISGAAPGGKGPIISAAGALANLIVSSIKESYLTGQQILTTGFAPGKDDWEYPNNGSVIKPGGHCAGQSLTMMWYYYEKRLNGSRSLFHSLDRFYVPGTNGDSLWQDNLRGYKFSSVIQVEYYHVDDWFQDKLRSMRDSSTQYIGWRAFTYSMLLTGEPQYVALAVKDKDGKISGHAIVTHKASLSEKKLFVTDPNYPGQERSIQFSDPYFVPYNTKQNANEADNSAYPMVAYIAKSCLINWANITQRWSEVQAGTIGTVPPGIFPEVHLADKTEGQVISKTTPYIVNLDTLRIWAQEPSVYIAVYDGVSGNRIIPGPTSPYDMVRDSLLVLKPGANEIGVYFGKLTSGDIVFADFQWLTIVYNALKPNVATINPTEGTAGDLLTINGSNFGDDKTKGGVYLWVTPTDVQLTDIVSWDTNRIVVRIPDKGSGGRVYVKVNGVASEYRINSGHLYFTYKIGPPLIQFITPDHGYGGETITICGKNFGKSDVTTGKKIVVNNRELFPDHPSEIPFWSDTLITIILPKTCIGGDLQLVNWSDPTKNSNIVQLMMDEPVVTGFSPASGPAYTVVTITGNNLGTWYWPQTGLTLNGTESQYKETWTRTEMTFKAGESGEIILTVCGKPVVVGYFTKIP